MPDVAPFGHWSSPLSAQRVAQSALRLSGVAVDGDDIYWLEGRPSEGGRVVLVRRGADGGIEDVLAREWNVRSRVHEYGGGAYAVANGIIYFVNFTDQQIYAVRRGDETPPQPLTASPACRYADIAIDATRGRLICVREDHGSGGEPANTIVAVGEQEQVLVSGHDFYSTPRLSPDGARLCWLAWRHPQMPWDGTELWLADVAADGSVVEPRMIAGGASESIYQPGWSPDGELFFVSDADGWWKLYRWRNGSMAPVVRNAPPNAEFGRPQWVFGSATWAFTAPDRLAVAYTQSGRWFLGTVHAPTGLFTKVETERAPTEWLAANPRHAVLIAGAPASPDAVVRLDVATGAIDVLRAASDDHLDPGYVSIPDAIEFPTDHGLTAHAFFYAPRNKDVLGPRHERPPLIVISHGGPTTATKATFDPAIQYWTSRGFAVADVNYGGSSGYGRAYRERLKGQWGVVDVEDVVHVARHLVTQGMVDVRRLIVRGGSAGGYTTLATLTFHPGVFSAGASYYGISDIEVLARDTHKFEARYLDSLVGPYPEAREVYRQRSPIHHADRLVCALILFQGLEDKVVPPNQSEMMAEAARRNGRPVEYHAFEGEQHGFRRADTIVRCLELELGFYLRVL